MTAEGRTQRAIQITREVLDAVLVDPFALILMTTDGMKPDYIEDQIASILEYLEKTSPEANKETEG